MKVWELAAATSFGILGVWILRVSEKFPPSFSQAPGPGFFPILLGGVIVGLSVLYLISVFADESPWKMPHLDDVAGRLVLVSVLIAILIYTWQYLRFEVGSFVFLFVLSTGFGRKMWKQNALFSVIVTAVIVVFFRYGLRVPL